MIKCAVDIVIDFLLAGPCFEGEEERWLMNLFTRCVAWWRSGAGAASLTLPCLIYEKVLGRRKETVLPRCYWHIFLLVGRILHRCFCDFFFLVLVV